MIICKLKEKDLDIIVNIEKEIFTSSLNKNDFLYELYQNPFSHYYVLIDNETIIGYIGFWITFEIAQLTNIAVRKVYQGKGYGQKLLDVCFQKVNKAKCDNITLEVRVSNLKAIKFYEKNGFIKVNIRKGYYQDNHEDAYLMIKPLGGYNE